jgi:ATP-binding cassette subfamily B protein
LPLIAAITHWFRANARESYRTVRLWIARINAYLQERLTGMATVQLYRREQRDFEAFDENDRRHRDANLQSIFYYAVFYPAVELVGALAASVILWVGGARIIADGNDVLTLGSLVAFLQYSQRFFRPISDLSEKFNILQGAMASSERIFGLLDTPVEIASSSRLPTANSQLSTTQAPVPGSVKGGSWAGPGGIRFENVTFAYVEGEPVLKNVSFEVRPGERIGIVGATGSGKTTIVSLLLRFYDVQGGRITVDGVDIREIDLADLRSLFGLVLQDVQLFAGTIAGNVRLGDESISDRAVHSALDAVHASSFVDRMPRGLDSLVAERGSTLSVGQKQLLSFARALAFNPRVLILDEATSSVDTDTELLIRDALKVVMRGRTTIAIAHRLSTIQDMNRILVMHRGELREAGTHQELLAVRGIYHRLYELQFESTTA